VYIVPNPLVYSVLYSPGRWKAAISVVGSGLLASRVETALAVAHGADPRWKQARQQQRIMARLLSQRHVVGMVVHAVADR
jgi:hypothetical protein